MLSLAADFLTLFLLIVAALILWLCVRSAEDDEDIGCKLDRVICLLEQSKRREVKMAGELEALQAEVERVKTIDESAVALIEGLAAQIEALKGDPAKLQELADSLRGSSDALAAAVQANTAG